MEDILKQVYFGIRKEWTSQKNITPDGLPIYTRQEERCNTISHFFGILIGIGVLISTSLEHHTMLGYAGGILFGVSLMMLYTASAVYHGTPMERRKEKKLLRLLDHCSVFLLVSGTAASLILAYIAYSADSTEWIFYAVVWLTALIGIGLLCTNLQKFQNLAIGMEVLIGFVFVIRSDAFLSMFGTNGLVLLLIGCGCYLIGLIFLWLGARRNWMHFVFHLLCLAGSIFHAICICSYVI